MFFENQNFSKSQDFGKSDLYHLNRADFGIKGTIFMILKVALPSFEAYF